MSGKTAPLSFLHTQLDVTEYRRPLPNGNWYKKFAMNRWVGVSEATARSRCLSSGILRGTVASQISYVSGPSPEGPHFLAMRK